MYSVQKTSQSSQSDLGCVVVMSVNSVGWTVSVVSIICGVKALASCCSFTYSITFKHISVCTRLDVHHPLIFLLVPFLLLPLHPLPSPAMMKGCLKERGREGGLEEGWIHIRAAASSLYIATETHRGQETYPDNIQLHPRDPRNPRSHLSTGEEKSLTSELSYRLCLSRMLLFARSSGSFLDKTCQTVFTCWLWWRWRWRSISNMNSPNARIHLTHYSSSLRSLN